MFEEIIAGEMEGIQGFHGLRRDGNFSNSSSSGNSTISSRSGSMTPDSTSDVDVG